MVIYLLCLRRCISVRGVYLKYILQKYSSIVILCIFWLTSGISVRVVYLKYIVKYCSGMVIYLPTLPYMLYVGSWCLFEIYIVKYCSCSVIYLLCVTRCISVRGVYFVHKICVIYFC